MKWNSWRCDEDPFVRAAWCEVSLHVSEATKERMTERYGEPSSQEEPQAEVVWADSYFSLGDLAEGRAEGELTRTRGKGCGVE